MTPPALQSGDASRTRRRRRTRLMRWASLYIFLPILVLLLVVQIILWSDLPRRIVVAALQRATGLDVRIGTLRVSLLGTTTLRDLSIRLPLDDAPLFSAYDVRIRHAPLPILAVLGQRGIDAIAIDFAELVVSEDDHEIWNIAHAAAVVRAARAHRSPAPPPSLPALSLKRSYVTLSRHGRPPVRLPLELDTHSASRTPSQATYTLTSQGMTAELSLAPVGLRHKARMQAQLHPELAALWLDPPFPVADIHLDWEGELRGDILTARLSLHQLAVDGASVCGTASIAAKADEVQIDTFDLQINAPDALDAPLLLHGKRAVLSPREVRIHLLQGVIPEGDFALTGAWDPASGLGRGRMQWKHADGVSLDHSGSAAFTIEHDPFGVYRFRASLASDGVLDALSWQVAGQVHVEGDDWRSFAGSVTLDRSAVHETDMGGLELTELHARLAFSWPRLTLETVRHPRAPSLEAEGFYDFAQRDWSIELATGGFEIPGPRRAEIELTASGHAKDAELALFRFRTEGSIIQARGAYRAGESEPLRADAEFRLSVPHFVDQPRATGSNGSLSGVLDVRGHLLPIRLQAEGYARAADFIIGDRMLETIDLDAEVEFDHLGLRTRFEPIQVLGGEVRLFADHALKTANTMLTIVASSIDVDRVALLLPDMPPLSGEAEATISGVMRGLDLDTFEVAGNFSIDRLGSALLADWQGPVTLSGDLRYRGGRLTLETDAYADDEGSFGADITFRPFEADDIRITGEIRRWPLRAPDRPIAGRIDAQADLILTRPGLALRGPFSAAATLDHDGQPFAEVALDASISDTRLDLSEIEISAFGGQVHSRLRIPLGDWTAAEGELAFEAVDLARLGEIDPRLAELAGAIDGRITIHPDTRPSAIAPLLVRGELTLHDGQIRGAELHSIELEASLGRETSTLSRFRASFAGGVVDLWSRLSFHDGEPFVYTHLEASDLALGQLVTASRVDFPGASGLINARASLGGYLVEPHRTFGDAEVSLRNADLGTVPLISQLYSLLNLGSSAASPGQGRGVARLRLEDDALQLARVQYFNRGADIIASGEIENIFIGTASPISGVAAAAVRPLRDNALPFADQFDRAVTAATGRAVSVRFSGTLAEIRTETVPFTDVTNIFQRMLGTRNDAR
ncbi:MAG: hypothetical protein KIT24_05935 [Phycisphaeraceae bacterium]|nr:hypothetical protein [Phycisphaeraceae bacterium]